MTNAPAPPLAAPSTMAVPLPSIEIVDSLALEHLVDLRTGLTALLGRVDARLIVVASNGSNERKARSRDDGSPLLDVREVAARLRVSSDYVYRHARDWPFTRRVGRALRFDPEGLTRWQSSRVSRS